MIFENRAKIYDKGALASVYHYDTVYDGILRSDVSFFNQRKEKIVGSFFQAASRAPGNPCLIYLHDLSSNHCDGFDIVPHFIGFGINVLLFDFRCCGLSEGDCFSYGYYEINDIEAAITYLKSVYSVLSVILYGKGFGAKLALKASNCYKHILGVICEDPIYSFSESIWDSSFCFIGRYMIQHKMNNHLKKKFGITIDSLDNRALIQKSTSPVFIMCSEDCRQGFNLFQCIGSRNKFINTGKSMHNVVAFVLDAFDLEVDGECDISDDFE